MGLGEGRVHLCSSDPFQPAVPIGKVALWMQTKLFLTLCPGLRTQHTLKTENLEYLLILVFVKLDGLIRRIMLFLLLVQVIRHQLDQYLPTFILYLLVKKLSPQTNNFWDFK